MGATEYASNLIEVLPVSMIEAKRWLLYKLIPVEGKKPIKKPYCCDGRPREGRLDSKEDLDRLCTFEQAISALNSGKYAGLGFALGDDGKGGVWQGVDFDECDKFDAVSMLVKSGLPGYVERSVSGNGWHCIGYGRPFNALGSRGVGIEAYCKARFFVVTGDCAGGDIEDLSGYVADELVPIYGRHGGASENNGAIQRDTQTLTDLRNALNYLALGADSYKSWTDVGLMLKTIEPEESGLGLWLDWSKMSDKFSRKECLEKWKTFRPESVTYKSIFYLASMNGWNNPGYSQEIEEIGSWRDGLICSVTKTGKRVLSRLHNAVLFLLNLEEFNGKFRFNEFSGLCEKDGKPLSDTDESEITQILEHHFDEKITTLLIGKAIDLVARKNPYNPLIDYLNGLSWDGKNRVKTLFVDHFGAEDNDYSRDVARSFMVSAVARAYSPGCKVDTMLILEGGQGIFKSSFIEELAGIGMYAEFTSDIESRQIYLDMRGKWVMDFGELSVFGKKDSEDIKRFITRLSDTFTPPYGRNSQTLPRRCVFVGTTNRDQYFRDDTGNRRFLPIKCEKEADIDRLKTDRDQLWAEAAHLYRSGWRWWDVRGASEQQMMRLEQDDWEEDVIAWVETFRSEEPVSTKDIAVSCLKMDIDKINQAVTKRIASILKNNGYKRETIRITSGKIAKMFVRHNINDQKIVKTGNGGNNRKHDK